MPLATTWHHGYNTSDRMCVTSMPLATTWHHSYGTSDRMCVTSMPLATTWHHSYGTSNQTFTLSDAGRVGIFSRWKPIGRRTHRYLRTMDHIRMMDLYGPSPAARWGR
eukprot:956975-Prorocentrum_minimum.AAC.1